MQVIRVTIFNKSKVLGKTILVYQLLSYYSSSINMNCFGKNFDRNINIVMAGQRKSGVTSVASVMAGIKPKMQLMPTKGVKKSSFKKGLL